MQHVFTDLKIFNTLSALTGGGAKQRMSKHTVSNQVQRICTGVARMGTETSMTENNGNTIYKAVLMHSYLVYM